MGRIARVIAVGVPHHITQKGEWAATVFQVEEDRRVYLQLLREYGERYAVRWWGYCLMSNHVHLVAVPVKENALANALRRAHSDYACYAKVKLRTSGHFWQNRYYSCSLDRVHQWTALVYVERNPIRAGMVSRAEDIRVVKRARIFSRIVAALTRFPLYNLNSVERSPSHRCPIWSLRAFVSHRGGWHGRSMESPRHAGR
jgi:REP element-mobilizing transposase RayT